MFSDKVFHDEGEYLCPSTLKGGIWIGITFSLLKRSSLNSPCLSFAPRSLFVAQMTRKSSLNDFGGT